jgi:mannose-6-phosphate isomerase-like protein (cupin superfamily)
MFLVLSGEFTVRMRDRDVVLREGELFVVPKGFEHCPVAAGEASVLLLERADTDQTGGVDSELRAGAQEWV